MVFAEVKLLVACLLIFYEGLLYQISSQTSARKMFTKLESNLSTVSITTSFDKNCPNGTYQNRALSPTQVGGWVFQSTFKNTLPSLWIVQNKLAPKNSHLWKNPFSCQRCDPEFHLHDFWLFPKIGETPQNGW